MEDWASKEKHWTLRAGVSTITSKKSHVVSLNGRFQHSLELWPQKWKKCLGTDYGDIVMALHFLPEWLDENLPEDFDPSDLSPYRALDRYADYVAEQLENPPLIMIDLERDSVAKIRQKLHTSGGSSPGCACGSGD
jgi:hypothetical protein